jgi:hypothetical protein
LDECQKIRQERCDGKEFMLKVGVEKTERKRERGEI